MFQLIDGTMVTEYHPILQENEWKFPRTVGERKDVFCNYVYDFILERHHTIMVNDTPCVTLGHGFTDNEVVKHDYFGTHQVVEDMKALPGWEKGQVDVHNTERDSKSGRIIRMY